MSQRFAMQTRTTDGPPQILAEDLQQRLMIGPLSLAGGRLSRNPKGVINVVTGDGKAGGSLVDNPDVLGSRSPAATRRAS